MTKVLLTTAISILLMMGNAQAQERSSDYSKLNSVLTLLSHTKSPYVAADVNVTVKNPTVQLKDVKIWLSEQDKVIAHGEIDSQGHLTLPVLPSAQAKNVLLHVNHSKDDVAINIETQITEPKSKTLHYNELFELLDDVNEYIELMAGGFAFAAPSMDALEFTFSEPARIEIKAKKKTYRYETDKDLKIALDVSKKLRAENPLIEFSHFPTSMAPAD
ncbi:DUF2987 domain-containing protein [Pseudoalteromonas fenneropenaei]|uniref:DUF2987 domain-containing protein n=1 Tax=Pseudoalteromonas fenneropenaei TaxID=1737459 RepID=A0ABV7CH68_9GAMM